MVALAEVRTPPSLSLPPWIKKVERNLLTFTYLYKREKKPKKPKNEKKNQKQKPTGGVVIIAPRDNN